ncbi:MAG: BACON domain-containing carbohydrate-binding protein [Acidobacteriota bacterium]
MRRMSIFAALSILALAATPSPSHHTARAATGNFAQCQYVVTPMAQSFAVRGGVGSLSVFAASNCAWTAASNTPWINITSATAGSGLGRVNYSVVANPNANQRTGVITVAGLNVIVTQAGTGSASCAVTPINAGQPVNGSLAPGDCLSPVRIRDGARPFADRYSFNASSGQPVVVSLTSADFDTYLYLLDANGTVISQNDDTGPNGNSRIPSGSGFFTLPSSGTFTIEATSFSNNGLGNYTLSLAMPAGGCTYAINPASQSFPTGGGTGTVNVSTQSGCTWTAMSNNSWITISSGGSGSGSGTVNFSVAANPAAARTGTITIAGLRFTITQSGTNGTACPTIAGINPSSGSPGGSVTITGTNFTGVTAVKFAGNVPAQFNFVSDTRITTVIPTGATNGPLTISKPTCPDAQTPGFTVNRAVASVSAASYLGVSLASESIVAAFGTGLATGVGIANSLPLPTTLLGTTVKVKDSAGAERLAPLFFVAPTQINFQIPPGTATGTANLTITGGDGTVSSGNVAITNVAPGLFTADASGQGLAAAVAFRIKADGAQSFEPVSMFDPGTGRFVAVPIDLGPEGDQVFLLLFGTGLRFRSSLTAASATIGGINSEVLYVGSQGDFVGLDQINLSLPRSLAGRGEVDTLLTVDGKTANTVKVKIK